MIDDSDATALTSIEDLQQYKLELLRQGDPHVCNEVVDSITYASLRCSDIVELIGYATDVTYPHYYWAIKVLQERGQELAIADRLALAEKLRIVGSDSYRGGLPSKLRSRTDRLFGNLGDLIDPSTQREMARALCTHRSRTRRRVGVRFLRRLGPLEEDVRALTYAWRSFSDSDALFALTRVNGGLAGSNCCQLLDLTSERIGDWDLGYLHAVILERFILDQAIDHEHAATAHATAYIRAVGRTRQAALEKFLLLAIPSLHAPDDLKLAASVAGRLRSRKLITAIEMQLAAIVDTHAPGKPPDALTVAGQMEM